MESGKCKEALTMYEYQSKAHFTSLNTLIGGLKWMYPALGLVNEGGEVAGKIKKFFRDVPMGPTEECPDVIELNKAYEAKFREDMKKEIGDCLWYIAELCTQLDLSLEEVCNANLQKLKDRHNRGVIKGSGDNR